MPDMNNEAKLRRNNAELQKRVAELEVALSEHEQTDAARDQAEEALRIERDNLKNIFEAMEDGIYIVNQQYDIQYVNPVLVKDFGVYEGRKCYEYFRDRTEECPWCKIHDVFMGKTVQWEWFFLKNGKTYDLIDTPLKNPDGSISKLAIFRDITERKQVEARLFEANRIINRSPAVAFLWKNEEGWPVGFVSENVEKLTGYSSQEFVERKIFYGEIIHSDDLERVAGEIASYSKEEGLQTFEHEPYRLITKSGAITWVDDKSYIRRDSRGIITHFDGIVYDITERMKLEEQLRQAQKMESVGRLAGGVAHDFNNMLMVIIGHAEMAMEKMDPFQRSHAHLTEIRTAAKRSADLTRQLLGFARKQTITPKVLDLNNTVGGMLKMLRRLIGEHIDFVWMPGSEVWPVKVDPSQIDQILTNLCVNSRDAIKGVGKISIETGNVTLDEACCADHPEFPLGEYVLLAVSDNGCGMDKETLDRLYEPFFTTKKQGEGTGLGLAMVYGVVKQNNGFIYTYSEPGQGTTFKIYLPRYAAKYTQMQKDSLAEPARGGHETILLVEDEPDILEITTIMLERQGYTVLAASTPGEAIHLAGESAGQIHLLMTDVVMPEMNGRDLAKHLLSFYPNLKCLFMSGYTANIIAHHGALDEGVHFIQKPFIMRDLASKVREAINDLSLRSK